MENTEISIVAIILFLIALYFVIKWGVKSGINQSMLFTDAERQAKLDEEMKQIDEQLKKK